MVIFFTLVSTIESQNFFFTVIELILIIRLIFGPCQEKKFNIESRRPFPGLLIIKTPKLFSYLQKINLHYDMYKLDGYKEK